MRIYVYTYTRVMVNRPDKYNKYIYICKHCIRFQTVVHAVITN